MLIPIPIGIKNVAAVQGTVWKCVTCERCRQPYAYLLELEATGEDHDLLFLDGEASAERARQRAEKNLVEKSRNTVVAVPCPGCGFYQEDMARKLKNDAGINPQQIAGAVIAALGLIPLVFGIPYLWLLTIALAVVGLAILAYGYVLAFRFDPNAGDPKPRKAFGRQHALWGEPMADLLAANPHADGICVLPGNGSRPRQT